jgi:hypothetical protein
LARSRLPAHAAGALTITAVLVTTVLTGRASACSCLPSTEGERFQRANHVFTGEVVASAVEENDPSTVGDDRYRYRVQVGAVHKGDVPPVVDVLTSIHGGTCGITMTVGTGYVVFASGDASDARVETGYCSGTRLASGGPPVTTVPTGSTTTTPCVAPEP